MGSPALSSKERELSFELFSEFPASRVFLRSSSFSVASVEEITGRFRAPRAPILSRFQVIHFGFVVRLTRRGGCRRRRRCRCCQQARGYGSGHAQFEPFGRQVHFARSVTGKATTTTCGEQALAFSTLRDLGELDERNVYDVYRARD